MSRGGVTCHGFLRFLSVRKGVRNRWCGAPFGPFGYWFLTLFLMPGDSDSSLIASE